MQRSGDLIVTRAPGRRPERGVLRFRHHCWPCVLGKNGISTRKTEGDMTTPAGRFELLYTLHNKTRIPFVATQLPLHATNRQDGWCDEPTDPNYNRQVRLPYRASHEKLVRDDHLYDLILVMDYNYTVRCKARGSAVFFHLTDRADHTAGCVAVDRQVMLWLLSKITPGTHMIIQP